jgi:hypothetical protein
MSPPALTSAQESKFIAVRAPRALIAAVRELAAQNGTCLSVEVRHALGEHVARERRREARE